MQQANLGNALWVRVKRGIEVANCGFFGVFLARPLTTITTIEDIVMMVMSLLVLLDARREVKELDATSGAFLSRCVTAGSGSLLGQRELSFGPEGDLYATSEKDDSIRFTKATPVPSLGSSCQRATAISTHLSSWHSAPLRRRYRSSHRWDSRPERCCSGT